MKNLVACGVGLVLGIMASQSQAEGADAGNPVLDNQPRSQSRTASNHFQGRIRIEKDRSEAGYLLRIHTSGDINPDSVQVLVQGNSILIENDRSFQREERNEGGYYNYSRNSSLFRRRISIPRGADVGKMQRRVEDGVLIITLPYLKPGR